MSGPYSADEPIELDERMATYYADMYVDHYNRPGTGRCGICGERNCQDSRFAQVMLVRAGLPLPNVLT